MNKTQFFKLYSVNPNQQVELKYSDEHAKLHYGLDKGEMSVQEISEITLNDQVTFKSDPDTSYRIQHCRLLLRSIDQLSVDELLLLIRRNQVFEYTEIISVDYNSLGSGEFKLIYRNSNTVYKDDVFVLQFSPHRLNWYAMEFLIENGIAVHGSLCSTGIAKLLN